MIGWLLRRVRFRGVEEGKVQEARVETHDREVRDEVERWQDYGLTSRPAEGHGLLLEHDGFTFLLRADKADERPQLEKWEVCLWHKDGAKIWLKEGGLVRIESDKLELVSTTTITLTAPGGVTVAAPSFTAPAVYAATSLKVNGVEMAAHRHWLSGSGGPITGVPTG